MSHFEELLAASALTKFANQASAKKESQTEKQTNKCSRFPVQVRNQNIFQSVAIHSSHNIISFTTKNQLMKLLECGKYEHIISWSPEGRSFVVHNPSLLVKEALPLFFEKPLKYTSFTRKLHRWGFVKVASNSFFNPKFFRGDLAGASSLSCHKGNSERDVSITSVPRVTRDIDKWRISPNTVQGEYYSSKSSLYHRNPPASFDMTTHHRMPPLVREATSGPTNAAYPFAPNLQDMGKSAYYGNSDVRPRDRDGILSIASRYNAMLYGRGENFGRSYESTYISSRRNHTDDLLFYLAKQRLQHNLLMRNAWKALKANDGSSF